MEAENLRHLKSYCHFSDERGSLSGIIQEGCWKEMNFLSSKAGIVRGGHYHKVSSELFYIISGLIRVEIQSLQGEVIEQFEAKLGDIFIIEPYEVHTFKVLSESQWINALSEPMNNETPDIYRVS